MKKFFYLSLLCFIFSCSSDKEKNPLVIPPNFTEIPDPNNIEKTSPEGQNASVDKLKDLLLNSD